LPLHKKHPDRFFLHKISCASCAAFSRQGANMAAFSADMAGAAGAMTESEPAERCQYNITID
jgi:hypothetical protein